MAVRTFNLNDIIFTVDGVRIKGSQDGDFLAIDTTSDDWTMQVGSDGETVRSYQNNETGRMTVTLMYGATDIDFLTALAKRDRETGNGVVPVSVADTRGSTLASSDAAWIVKRAPVTLGRDAGSVEFMFDCSPLVLEAGSLRFNGLAG